MKRMNEEKLSEMADFIRTYIEEHNGTSPKFSKILSHMGMNNSVGYRYLTTLRDRGSIEYNGRDTLRIKGQERLCTQAERIAIYGSIPCGTPEDCRQELLGHVAIPSEWIDGECYLLRASGDSMIDVGIDDGDLVLIRRTLEAHDRQIIAVLTEEGTTLKRFCLDGKNRPYLMAENSNYPDSRRYLYPQKITVQGLACKIIKSIV